MDRERWAPSKRKLSTKAMVYGHVFSPPFYSSEVVRKASKISATPLKKSLGP